jgi:hypothetical protein
MDSTKLINRKKLILENLTGINNDFPYRSALAIIIFSVLAGIILVFIYSGLTIVPWAMYPPFGDMISITGGVDCVRAGYDPYIFYGFDPWFRLFNYPKIWLNVFGFFNLDRETTNYIGIILICSYALVTIFLFNLKRIIQLLFIIILVLSPPVLLLLERANSDLIIYLLTITSVYYLRRIRFKNEDVKVHLIYLVILFATILKLYPAFLLPLLFFEKISRKNMLIILIYSAGILATYFLINFNDLLLISKNTPRPNDALSFGKNVGLNHYFNSGNLAIFSNMLFALFVAAALYVSLRFKDRLHTMIYIPSISKCNIYLFLAGGLLYTGTFFIGNNYDYRFVFLILMFPFLTELFDHSGNKILIIAAICVSISLFYGAFITHFIKVFEVLKILTSWGLCFFIFLIIFHLFINKSEIK